METELAILFDDVRILQMSRMFQCQYGISLCSHTVRAKHLIIVAAAAVVLYDHGEYSDDI